MTFNAAGLSVMVRWRRTHRLSVWGAGSAWAMAGGAVLGASVKSGIWGGVDAPTTAANVVNAMMERQRAIVRERSKESRRPPSPAGDCRIGVVCSMQFSLVPNDVNVFQSARAMPFL